MRPRKVQKFPGLRIDTALDGVAAKMNLTHSIIQFFAGCDSNLRLDQIRAGHKFSHRMLTWMRVFISIK